MELDLFIIDGAPMTLRELFKRNCIYPFEECMLQSFSFDLREAYITAVEKEETQVVSSGVSALSVVIFPSGTVKVLESEPVQYLTSSSDLSLSPELVGYQLTVRYPEEGLDLESPITSLKELECFARTHRSGKLSLWLITNNTRTYIKNKSLMRKLLSD